MSYVLQCEDIKPWGQRALVPESGSSISRGKESSGLQIEISTRRPVQDYKSTPEHK